MLDARVLHLALLVLAAHSFGCGDSGSSSTGGGGAGGGSAPSTNTGSGAGGANGMGGDATGGAGGTGEPPPPDPCIAAGTCPPGEWINVTPAGMDPSLFEPAAEFGAGSIVRDPVRPNAMYVAGSTAGLWKSEDYGNTFTLLNDSVPDAARGVLIAVAGTTPPTLWVAGHLVVYKSIDDGATFEPIPVDVDLYSLMLDPYDNDHLVSGLHEVDGIAESIDGGETWALVGGTGFPAGGVSWYPFFIDTGDAATTRGKWLAIPQNGGGAVMTDDGGGSWTAPNGLEGLTHAHGNSRIHQDGQTLFAAGEGPDGWGVYRSADLGDTWSLAESSGNTVSMVWGTASNVYSMWAWACAACDIGANFKSAPMPGTSWSPSDAGGLHIGPNSLVVSSDGTHNVFVGMMWAQGLWRYIEP